MTLLMEHNLCYTDLYGHIGGSAMPRIAHGEVVASEQLQDAERELASTGGTVSAFAAAGPGDLRAFGFLFSDLQGDQANLLPQSADTLGHLKDLGRAMGEPGTGPGDSGIPAIYTYFGQFVDHDITLEQSSFTPDKLVAADMVPLSVEQIQRDLKNLRHPTLDLDSVYGPTSPPGQAPPRDGNKMRIGRVTRLTDPPLVVRFREKPFLRVRLKDDDNDLPREPPNDQDVNHDRAALIGDPRNDENLIVSQLHVAFLKAHNKLVQQGKTFDQARRLLRQHYQHIIIHDFLRRVADPAIVDRIVQHGNSVYHALAEPFFVPLEFTVAAYRFGHTMVRGSYDFNLNFNPADLFFLFTFTAFSGQLGGDVAAIQPTKTLPDNWIIEWHRFVDTLDTKASNKARRIDTMLADGLFSLQDVVGNPLADDEARLAVRNLLRGYGLRIPTGQAVARQLHLPPLTAAQIKQAAASPAQVRALEAGRFLDRTPLWYYLLAEAAHPSFGNGQRLGPAGSTIVAEVLIGLARRSEDSILGTPNWQPSLPAARPGHFELADLLRFAGVLPRTYKVQAHDTLSTIATDHLGDVRRWAEIFVLNRDDIHHRDRIPIGQVLLLPGDTPAPLRPRLHKVQANDTLSGLAKQNLGSAQRFPEIHDLNRDVLGPNPGLIHLGQELVILPP
jgi:nucleoid-associated protein YgaU